MKSKIETVLYTETINFKHFIRHNQAQLDLYFIFYHKKPKEKKGGDYDLYYKDHIKYRSIFQSN